MKEVDLPEPESAMATLAARQRRAIGLLAFRVMLLCVLSGVIKVQMPWMRQLEVLLDAGAGVLALWPFWTAVGRNWQWRIALGTAYANSGRPADAVRVLSALDGIQGRLFDARGDGAAALAAARRALA